MNDYQNYVEISLQTEDEFINELKTASGKLWDDIRDVFFSKNGREVKAFITEDKTSLYVLEKKDNKFNVFKDEIHSFNKEATLKEHMYYPLKSLKAGTEIRLHKIVSFSIQKNSKKKSQSLIDNKMLEDIKKIGKFSEKDWKNVVLMLNKEERKITATISVDEIKKYVDYVASKGFIKKYKDSFYKSLVKPLNSVVQEKLENIQIEMEYMKSTCEANKFSSNKKSFVFNDLDNQIWVKGDKLIVSDQTCGFYIDSKDRDNFTIYFLEKEYESIEKEIKRVEDGLKNESIDEIKQVILKVEAGKVKFANNALLWVYELDSNVGCQALEEAGYGKRGFPVDVNSYEYHKNYYFTKYRMSEFDFLVHAFLTLGGGLDYDEKEGRFKDGSIEYLGNLKSETLGRTKKFNKITYCDPKKVSYLDKDWTDGLKYMVEVLKRDMPTPIVFYKNTAKESVESAINFYEQVINKLESNAVKKAGAKKKNG